MAASTADGLLTPPLIHLLAAITEHSERVRFQEFFEAAAIVDVAMARLADTEEDSAEVAAATAIMTEAEHFLGTCRALFPVEVHAASSFQVYLAGLVPDDNDERPPAIPVEAAPHVLTRAQLQQAKVIVGATCRALQRHVNIVCDQQEMPAAATAMAAQLRAALLETAFAVARALGPVRKRDVLPDPVDAAQSAQIVRAGSARLRQGWLWWRWCLEHHGDAHAIDILIKTREMLDDFSGTLAYVAMRTIDKQRLLLVRDQVARLAQSVPTKSSTRALVVSMDSCLGGLFDINQRAALQQHDRDILESLDQGLERSLQNRYQGDTAQALEILREMWARAKQLYGRELDADHHWVAMDIRLDDADATHHHACCAAIQSWRRRLQRPA